MLGIISTFWLLTNSATPGIRVQVSVSPSIPLFAVPLLPHYLPHSVLIKLRGYVLGIEPSGRVPDLCLLAYSASCGN